MSEKQLLFNDAGDESTVNEMPSENIMVDAFSRMMTTKSGSSENLLQRLQPSPEAFPTSKLYSSEEKRGVELGNSIRLLTEALKFAKEALELYQEENIFGSEDSMQKIHLLLPELFCCRELGDGFGLIVMGLYHAHDSLDGEPFNEKQILEIKHLLRVLLDEPYLSTELALDRVLNLELVGLKVSPKRIDSQQETLDA
jgi:hypothetical protein